MEDLDDMKEMMSDMNEMTSGMNEMMGGWMGGGMMAVFIFWLVFGVVLIALAITTLVWMIRAIRRQGPTSSTMESKPEHTPRPSRGETPTV